MTDELEARPATQEAIPGWLRKLVWALDDLVPIPGLDRGIGLDAILGLVPGAGDAASAVISAVVLIHALRRGVPPVVLARMVMNLLADSLLGSVPGVGDVFDVFFRANRRNLELLERHAEPAREPGFADYAVVALGLTAVGALLALPFVVGFWLVRLVTGH